MDVLTIEQRRKNMQAIRSVNTKAEVLLSKSLWKLGYRYRKNDPDLPGKPDISLKKYKIAIFCDGEFWHGKDWENKKLRLEQNKTYWVKKIERNIERDREVNQKLKDLGWLVLRFWDKQIQKQLGACIECIELEITKKK